MLQIAMHADKTNVQYRDKGRELHLNSLVRVQKTP